MLYLNYGRGYDNRMSRYEQRLNSGIPLYEAASALQKAIRRGHEEVAFWWAKEMAESGYHAYCWKRLTVIASEDIGNADPLAAILVGSLWTTWRAVWEQQGKKPLPSFDILAQAILYLCRAPKSREADELVCYIEELEKTGWKPQVPHYALDAHTDRGRAKLRAAGVRSTDPLYWDSWWHEGTKLINPTGESRYHGRLDAYDGDPQADKENEQSHATENHRCDICSCLGDVVCADCDGELCIGHAVACEGLCGRYWCPVHTPAITMCVGCIEIETPAAPGH